MKTVASLEEWEKLYSVQMPVVLTPNDTSYAQQFDRSELLANYGEDRMIVGTPEEISRGEQSMEAVTSLRDFAAEMREKEFSGLLSVYDELFLQKAQRLHRDLPFPLSVFNGSSNTANRFVAALALGADSTSVVFQYCEDKYIHLLAGQTIWFLLIRLVLLSTASIVAII